MSIIKYKLRPFKREEAASGKLCVCVHQETSEDGWVYSKLPGEQKNPFIGAGIPVYKDYKFHLTINGELYVFNDRGEANNSTAINKESKLLLGKIVNDVFEKGAVIATHIKPDTTTRSGEEGYLPADEEYIEDAENVYIDNLNARDNFAIQALQMLLRRMEKDPSTLSDDEMSQISDTAYKWAANMMIAAANARANLDDKTATTDVEPAPIGELENNSEKLLNNIIYALQKTDYEEDTGEVDEEGNPIMEYSERLINPKMNKIFKDYLKATDDYEDNDEIEPLPNEDEEVPEGEEPSEYWSYEAIIKLLRRLQLKKTLTSSDDVDEYGGEVGDDLYLQRIVNPREIEILKAFLKPTATSGTKEYIELVEFLDLYKKFFKSTTQGQDYAAFEDLTKLLKDLQATLDGNKWQRVTLYKWEDFKTVLTDIKTGIVDIKTNIATLNTTLTNAFQAQATALDSINQSLQAFTTAMNTRLDNIQADTAAVRANYATSGDVDSAKDDIIDAMPQCKYTPSSE